jgi:hypothetical protein
VDEGIRQEPASEPGTDQGSQTFQYEPLERFGEGLTTSRPWNQAALAGVERLNGRVAMIGFLAALIGEELTGRGIVGQLGLMLRWLLG